MVNNRFLIFFIFFNLISHLFAAETPKLGFQLPDQALKARLTAELILGLKKMHFKDEDIAAALPELVGNELKEAKATENVYPLKDLEQAEKGFQFIKSYFESSPYAETASTLENLPIREIDGEAYASGASSSFSMLATFVHPQHQEMESVNRFLYGQSAYIKFPLRTKLNESKECQSVVFAHELNHAFEHAQDRIQHDKHLTPTNPDLQTTDETQRNLYQQISTTDRGRTIVEDWAKSHPKELEQLAWNAIKATPDSEAKKAKLAALELYKNDPSLSKSYLERSIPVFKKALIDEYNGRYAYFHTPDERRSLILEAIYARLVEGWNFDTYRDCEHAAEKKLGLIMPPFIDDFYRETWEEAEEIIKKMNPNLITKIKNIGHGTAKNKSPTVSSVVKSENQSAR